MKKHIIFLIALAVFTVGCSEEFLETEPTEFISANRVAEISEVNPGVLSANLQGIYANMYLTGTGGTDGHDDHGQKGYDTMSDFLSGDMVLGNTRFGWYSIFTQYLITVDFTQTDNYQFWRYYYRIILGANIVIDGLGGEDVVPEVESARHVMGQAKAMRAYGYFYLAQFFDADYNPSSPLLPIYRNSTVPNQPLSSTSEVYDLIVSDLTDAVTLLEGYSRPGKFAVNQDVARGLLAYTYAAMGEDALAAEQAKAVIDAGNFSIKSQEVTGVVPAPSGRYPSSYEAADDVPLSELTDGFNDLSSPSWMWGTDLTADMGLGLVSWWGKHDIFSYSYAWVGDYKSVNYELYQAIPEDDIRKNQFIQVSADDFIPNNKFYSDDQRRFGGTTRTVTADLVYMRVEEMYLLHAESAAKAGDEAAARTSLKALMENRVPDASYVDGLSGQALLDEIFLQTRIEFVAEGKSYLLKKRNRIDVVTGSNHIHIPSTTFPIGSDEITVDIPQLEVINNPEISQDEAK